MESYNETLFEIITEDAKTRGGIILPQENQTNSMSNQLKAYSVLIPSLGAIIILTNLVVVVSSGLILKSKQQPRCTYLLLGNVAMSDLITGIAVIIGNVYPKDNRTHLVCTVQIGMIVSTTIASVYSVGLIAIDRYVFIVHGLMYNQWMYPKRARISISLTWLLGLVIGFLPLMGWSGDTDNGRICWLTLVYPAELIILITILGFIPVTLVICLYSMILIKAYKKVIQLKNSDNGNVDGEPKLRIFRGNQAARRMEISTIDAEISKPEPSRSSDKTDKNKFKPAFLQSRNSETEGKNKNSGEKQSAPNKWKAIKVVMLTTGSFVFTWCPYFIACTIFVFCDFEKTPGKCQSLKYAIASPLAILGFFNSLLNPIIYAWWHNGFRKTIKKIFCKKQAKKAAAVTPRAAPISLKQTSSTASTSVSSARTSSINETPRI